MESFLIRLLIIIGIIWLTQTILATFQINAQASKIIFVIVVLLAVFWLLTGATTLSLR